MKKTIALTLLSLASVFALSTTAVKAEQSYGTGTNLTTQGDGISLTVPSLLQFNDFIINADEGVQSVNAEMDLSINVSDLRGTHGGWQVTAEHNGLSALDKTDELDGATISLKDGTLTNNVDVSTNAPTLNPDSLDPTLPISIGKTPVVISKAAPGYGMGAWGHTWAKDKVTLTIPAIEARDMYADKYSTTITWNLIAGPQDTDTTPTGES